MARATWTCGLRKQEKAVRCFRGLSACRGAAFVLSTEPPSAEAGADLPDAQVPGQDRTGWGREGRGELRLPAPGQAPLSQRPHAQHTHSDVNGRRWARRAPGRVRLVAWVLLLLLVHWGRHCEPLTDWAARTDRRARGAGRGPRCRLRQPEGRREGRRAREARRSAKCLFGSVLLGKNSFSCISVGARRRRGRVGTGTPLRPRACVVPARYRRSPPDPLAGSRVACSVPRTPQRVPVQAPLRATWCLRVAQGSSHLTCRVST